MSPISHSLFSNVRSQLLHPRLPSGLPPNEDGFSLVVSSFSSGQLLSTIPSRAGLGTPTVGSSNWEVLISQEVLPSTSRPVLQRSHTRSCWVNVTVMELLRSIIVP